MVLLISSNKHPKSNSKYWSQTFTQNVEEATLSNSFNKASISLTPKQQKTELGKSLANFIKCNSKENINKFNLAKDIMIILEIKKYMIDWLSMISQNNEVHSYILKKNVMIISINTER